MDIGSSDNLGGRARRIIRNAKTPGQAAHDTWCADDDWDELSDAERDLWEATAQAGADVVLAALRERLVALTARWRVAAKRARLRPTARGSRGAGLRQVADTADAAADALDDAIRGDAPRRTVETPWQS